MIKDFSNKNFRTKLKIQKDYKRKKFVNPYFNDDYKKDKTAGFNTKLYLKIIAVIFLLYVVLYSDLFRLKTIEITGTDLINPEELRQLVEEQTNSWRWFLLPQDNLWLISKGEIILAIEQKYKLEKIEIRRSWKKLKINVKESINSLVIRQNDKLFFTDKEGVITREILPAEASSYLTKFPILNTAQEVKIGESIVSAKMVDFILKLNEKIKPVGLAVEYYESESGALTEISLVTGAGWRAHFDINNDLATSLDNLQLILNDKIKDQGQLEYIDLRFGNKIFYK